MSCEEHEQQHHGHDECCGGQGGCDCGGNCDCGGSCDCGEPSGFRRRYRTKAEQIVVLDKYLSELKTEIQAVEEQLAMLRQ
jgi:hypothetical protein